MDGYLITLWVQVGFVTFLASILIFQMMKRNAKPLKWIIYVLLLSLLRALMEITINPDRVAFDPWKSSHFIIYNFSILALYHYGEYALGDKPMVRRASIIYGLTGAFIALLYSGTLMDLSSGNPDGWPFPNSVTAFWEFPFDLFQIAVWGFMFYVFAKMVFFSKTREGRFLSFGLLVSAGIFLFVSVYEISEHFTGIEVSAAMTTIPAFLILIGVYAYNPRFSYSSPVELYRILLIHESGPTIVEEVFGDKYLADDIEHVLLGGVTSSLNTMFQEMTKSSGDLQVMKSTTSTLLFTKAPNVFAILECAKSTHLLRNALDDFANDFAATFEKDLSDFRGDVNIFDDYKKIFLSYFPFMDEKLLDG